MFTIKTFRQPNPFLADIDVLSSVGESKTIEEGHKIYSMSIRCREIGRDLYEDFQGFAFKTTDEGLQLAEVEKVPCLNCGSDIHNEADDSFKASVCSHKCYLAMM